MTTTFIKRFCIFFLLYFQSPSIIMAKSQTNVISEFKQALLKNDKKLMRSYVTEGIELPIPSKNRPIYEINIMPPLDLQLEQLIIQSFSPPYILNKDIWGRTICCCAKISIYLKKELSISRELLFQAVEKVFSTAYFCV
ncbi:hypothetical protein ACUXEY_005249 [Bacillus sp. F9_6S_D1_P_5]